MFLQKRPTKFHCSQAPRILWAAAVTSQDKFVSETSGSEEGRIKEFAGPRDFWRFDE
jgi:hypothetical protein